MELYFDYDKLVEHNFSDLVKSKVDHHEYNGYPLFSHFLDFISIDSEDFLTSFYEEYSLINERTSLLDLTNQFNQKYSVNFCVGFYLLLLQDISNIIGIPPSDNNTKTYLDPKAVKFAVKNLTSHIHIDAPINLSQMIDMCNPVFNLLFSDTRLPPQSFLSISNEISFKKQPPTAPYEYSLNDYFLCRREMLECSNDYVDGYSCNSLPDLIVSSLYEIVKSSYKIKKCLNCGRYFIPYVRSDAIYCDRPSPTNQLRTCKEVGAEKARQAKVNNDKLLKLQRNINSTKAMRVKRSMNMPEYSNYLESYEAFKNERNEWKLKIKEAKNEEEKIQLEKKFMDRLQKWNNGSTTWLGKNK